LQPGWPTKGWEDANEMHNLPLTIFYSKYLINFLQKSIDFFLKICYNKNIYVEVVATVAAEVDERIRYKSCCKNKV
jgi:hypothetical protein